MKTILLIALSALLYTTTRAQNDGKPAKDTATKIIRICAPSRSGIIAPKPMVLVYTHHQTIGIHMEVDSISKIDPKFIKSIKVLKDSAATRMYGDAAKAGVIQVYIDDEKYPDAYKLFDKKGAVKQ
jgi:hypothetical protein